MAAGWKTLAAVAVVAALAGGAAGAAVTLLWRDGDQQQRGQLVRIGGPQSLPNIATTPWCDDFDHFCITEPAPGQFVALYTYDTNPLFRALGCTVQWNTTFVFTNDATGQHRTGWFITGCGGAIWDMSGH